MILRVTRLGTKPEQLGVRIPKSFVLLHDISFGDLVLVEPGTFVKASTLQAAEVADD